MRTLHDLGWTWHEDGAILRLQSRAGDTVDWFVPLDFLRSTFSRELAAVGCPVLDVPTVGGSSSVSGFFGGIKRAFRGASRAVKKAVPKAITRAARSVQRTAVRSAKRYGALERAGLNIFRRVPGASNLASAMQHHADIRQRFLTRGKGPTRRKLMRYGKSAARAGVDVAANVVLPGSGLASNAALQGGLRAGQALAQGQRWDRALRSGAVTAAHRYGVPKAATRAGLDFGGRVARGQRIDRAAMQSGRAAASRELARRLPAPASFARGVLPGMPRGLAQAIPRQVLRQLPTPRGLHQAQQHARRVEQHRRALALARSRYLR